MSTIVAFPSLDPVDVRFPTAANDDEGPRPPDPASMYGLPWRQVFTIRNTVALRYCERFHRLIPEEEFFSIGNLAICEAFQAYRPGKASFTSFLWMVLSRRMRSVVEHEWAGTIQRTYTGSKATHRRTSTTYIPPRFEPVAEDAWTRPATQEHRALLAEIVRYVEAHIDPLNRAFFLERLAGTTPTELEHTYGLEMSAIVNRIRHVRERVVAWAEEARV